MHLVWLGLAWITLLFSAFRFERNCSACCCDTEVPVCSHTNSATWGPWVHTLSQRAHQRHHPPEQCKPDPPGLPLVRGQSDTEMHSLATFKMLRAKHHEQQVQHPKSLTSLSDRLCSSAHRDLD